MNPLQRRRALIASLLALAALPTAAAALKCEGCGGRMKFIAVIKDRAVIERILRHIGEDAQEPRFARARDPYDVWA